MAWAASMSSGRKTSPPSKASPTWLMPATKPSLMISLGAMPAASARRGDVGGGGRVVVDDRVDRLLDELVPVGHSVQLLLKKSCRPLALHQAVGCAVRPMRRAKTGAPFPGRPSIQDGPRASRPSRGDRLDTMSPCGTTARSSGPPAKPRASSCRSPTAAPTPPATSARPISTSPSRCGPRDEVQRDLSGLPDSIKERVRRVFLADGDALALSRRRLDDVLGLLRHELPALERVSCYANARNLLTKSADDLRAIRRAGLELLYLGLESGDDDDARGHPQGGDARPSRSRPAPRPRRRASTCRSRPSSVWPAPSARRVHAAATGAALSAIDPQYIGVLSLMVEPGTRMEARVRSGEFVVPDALAMLRELREHDRRHRRDRRRVSLQPRLELPARRRPSAAGQAGDARGARQRCSPCPSGSA